MAQIEGLLTGNEVLWDCQELSYRRAKAKSTAKLVIRQSEIFVIP